MNNYGQFDVSPQRLCEDLHLPEGTEIAGAEWDFGRRCIVLFAFHPSFPEQMQGIAPYPSQVMYTEYTRPADPGDVIRTIVSEWS